MFEPLILICVTLSSYTIKGNAFHGGKAALQVHNSSSLYNVVYPNLFHNVNVIPEATVIMKSGKNRSSSNAEVGLYLRCNRFANSVQYAMALKKESEYSLESNMKKTQGNQSVLIQYTFPADLALNLFDTRGTATESDFWISDNISVPEKYVYYQPNNSSFFLRDETHIVPENSVIGYDKLRMETKTKDFLTTNIYSLGCLAHTLPKTTRTKSSRI
ncbi:MAG: hypothetical protein HY738_05485 [Bacteroidia bacterium]|nr:hypothetical protein [Bacteroidia bacterium]